MSKSASFALNTIDLLTNPDKTHYIVHNGPAKVPYFSQLALASQQYQGKELQRVKAVHCALQRQKQTPNKPAQDTHSQASTLKIASPSK